MENDLKLNCAVEDIAQSEHTKIDIVIVDEDKFDK